jgi:hypothetical protein
MSLSGNQSARFRVLASACLVIVAAFTFAGCSSGGDHSTAYKLATLDNGAPPPSEDDAAVEPYRTALQRLSTLCRDSPSAEKIGNEALKAQELLLEQVGRSESLLEILQGAVSVHEAANGNAGTCPEIFALIVASS